MPSFIIFLPLLIPLTSAVFCLGSWNNVRVQRWIYLVGALLMVAASAALLLQVTQQGFVVAQAGGWKAPVGITFVADYFSALMVLVTAIICLAIYFYGKGSLDKPRQSSGFYPMSLLLVFGVTGSFLTGDVFNLFVWFEVMLMASFVLLTLVGEQAQL